MNNEILKISDLIRDHDIHLDVPLVDKDAVLVFLAETAEKNGRVADAAPVLEGLRAREASMSTGLGNGLAFPHTLSGPGDQTALMIVRLLPSLSFGAIDDREVDIVFAIIVPESDPTLHLRILAALSRLCRNPAFPGRIRRAGAPAALLESIRAFETECRDCPLRP